MALVNTSYLIDPTLFFGKAIPEVRSNLQACRLLAAGRSSTNNVPSTLNNALTLAIAPLSFAIENRITSNLITPQTIQAYLTLINVYDDALLDIENSVEGFVNNVLTLYSRIRHAGLSFSALLAQARLINPGGPVVVDTINQFLKSITPNSINLSGLKYNTRDVIRQVVVSDLMRCIDFLTHIAPDVTILPVGGIQITYFPGRELNAILTTSTLNLVAIPVPSSVIIDGVLKTVSSAPGPTLANDLNIASTLVDFNTLTGQLSVMSGLPILGNSTTYYWSTTSVNTIVAVAPGNNNRPVIWEFNVDDPLYPSNTYNLAVQSTALNMINAVMVDYNLVLVQAVNQNGVRTWENVSGVNTFSANSNINFNLQTGVTYGFAFNTAIQYFVAPTIADLIRVQFLYEVTSLATSPGSILATNLNYVGSDGITDNLPDGATYGDIWNRVIDIQAVNPNGRIVPNSVPNYLKQKIDPFLLPWSRMVGAWMNAQVGDDNDKILKYSNILGGGFTANSAFVLDPYNWFIFSAAKVNIGSNRYRAFHLELRSDLVIFLATINSSEGVFSKVLDYLSVNNLMLTYP